MFMALVLLQNILRKCKNANALSLLKSKFRFQLDLAQNHYKLNTQWNEL